MKFNLLYGCTWVWVQDITGRIRHYSLLMLSSTPSLTSRFLFHFAFIQRPKRPQHIAKSSVFYSSLKSWRIYRISKSYEKNFDCVISWVIATTHLLNRRMCNHRYCCWWAQAAEAGFPRQPLGGLPFPEATRRSSRRLCETLKGFR